MQIVNGYVCHTSCDVAAAKKGHDPKNPHGGPVKAKQLEAADPSKAATDRTDKDAVVFGGSLAALSATQARTASAPLQLVDRFA